DDRRERIRVVDTKYLGCRAAITREQSVMSIASRRTRRKYVQNIRCTSAEAWVAGGNERQRGIGPIKKHVRLFIQAVNRRSRLGRDGQSAHEGNCKQNHSPF